MFDFRARVFCKAADKNFNSKSLDQQWSQRESIAIELVCGQCAFDWHLCLVAVKVKTFSRTLKSGVIFRRLQIRLE